MLKKQAGELQDDTTSTTTTTDAGELFTKGASVKLLAGKMDVGSKELSKVSQYLIASEYLGYIFSFI